MTKEIIDMIRQIGLPLVLLFGIASWLAKFGIPWVAKRLEIREEFLKELILTGYRRHDEINAQHVLALRTRDEQNKAMIVQLERIATQLQHIEKRLNPENGTN